MFKKTLNLVSSVLQITDTKMVLVVRSDLKMERGKVASQCAHAAVISYQQALDSPEQSKIARIWYRRGQPKIVLKIDGHDSLQTLYKNALENRLNAVLVHDAGRTQVERGTVTVLGIGPNEKSVVDKVTSHLKLY